MLHKSRLAVSGFVARLGLDAGVQAAEQGIADGATRPFDLLRWFSVLSFVTIAVFTIAFATTQAHFLRREILQRDATLTSQFIFSVAETQMRQAKLAGIASLGQVLDERTDFAKLGVDPRIAADVRNQFFEHLRVLPDVLLATVFGRDRKIIWATNPKLIGTISKGNDELEEAFAARVIVSTEYDAGREYNKKEQRFLDEPEKFFVENYVPLFDRAGDVVAVVEVYKEPMSLVKTIERGNVLVWSCTALGAIFLYIALFWIIRRADAMLKEQKRRLIESEALCVIGEMSAAVAHGIRNPLASIRSSAELALDGDPESTRKNASDIISQVDRLGKWIRDLLVFSRPVTGENQPIELGSLVDECLPNFTAQFRNGGVSCEVVRSPSGLPFVVGNRALAMQGLASVISNALEAMPKGGTLTIEVKPSLLQRRVDLIVTDTGSGIAPAQLGLVFKPFFTTKRKGLGLGMSQVKRIMERFGGAITLHSREGEGTRVCMSFRIA